MTNWAAQYFYDGDEEPFFTDTIEAETYAEAVPKAWAPVVENVPVGRPEETTHTVYRTGIASRVRVLAQGSGISVPASGDIVQNVPPALKSGDGATPSNK